jgi:hypothetical protein
LQKFGDNIVEKSEKFGLALLCYARAQNRRKVKSVVDLLISYSLVQSRAYPATTDLDPELRSMLKEPKACLSAIASVDEEAARILQFYLSGYATLRRFYEIRDEAVELQDGQCPRFKPLARRRAAAQALAAVIGSAADNIYGGLYDPERDPAVQVDGLLALLGEALVFVNRKSDRSLVWAILNLSRTHPYPIRLATIYHPLSDRRPGDGHPARVRTVRGMFPGNTAGAPLPRRQWVQQPSGSTLAAVTAEEVRFLAFRIDLFLHW